MAAKRGLLITFDALGTLYRPRKPIAYQYGQVAESLGFPSIPESDIQESFRNGNFRFIELGDTYWQTDPSICSLQESTE